MIRNVTIHCLALACALLSLAQSGFGQTIAIAEGVQTYETLTNTTVTMTGKSELRVTSASTPISGCQIHLNSSDAWLLLSNIRPSVVNSSYLGQIRVNGAAATLNTNCRIVQHGDGTMVIPQSSSFAPLQVFTGKYFTGTSTSLQNHTAYNDSSLGVFSNTVSSFKLKRGYTATFAQNANGTGVSRNYVAQDGDLEISVMPDDLNDSVSFVRIFPWRWVNKKGIAGNIASGLNVRWDYNWNIDRNSTLDVEYVPIRQERWWPDLAQNWQTRGSNHLLGYNEPDSADQANLAVGDAIWSWPDLLGTGLRVGSPAPTDGGLSWLYSFVDQADAASLRCDFVAVHYYRSYASASDPVGATTQFYNFLKGVHDRTKRPLWVTEWNNGASWTTGPDPTAAQQQATIEKMIEMLDNTPFVERYSLYNWVEDVRRVKWDDGSLTAAGVTYRDKVSPIGYLQVVPTSGGRGIAQLALDGDTLDSSGYGNSGLAVGNPPYIAGQRGQAMDLDGAAGYVQLPDKVTNSAAFSFVGWVNWDGGASWQRIFDFGVDTTHYMFLTPSSGGGKLRFVIRNGGSEQIVETSSALATGQWKHVAVTLSGGTARIYVNGVQAASGAVSITPAQFSPSRNFLGKSQFLADPLFSGGLDDVRIADYAFSAAQVASLMTDTPPQFTASPIAGPAGSNGVAYTGTLAGTATDAGDTITYAKASGPAWLQIASNGALSGTPALADVGTNEFIVSATDSAGATAHAVLTIQVSLAQASIVWDGGVGGTGTELSTAANWTGDVVPNGSASEVALFNGTVPGDLSLTYNTTSTNLGNANGISISLANGQTGALTLDGTASSPNLRLGNNAVTIAPEAGTLTFGNGSGTFNITLGYGASTQTFTNNSTNTATFKSDVVFANGGAAAHTLAFSGSGNWLLNNPIAGGSTFSLAKSGGGALTLTGANSYSGITTLEAGILNLNSAGALGGSGAITIYGGTINNTSGAAVSISTAKAQTWAGDFHFGGTNDLNLGNGVVTLAGSNDRTITLAGGKTLTVGRISSTIGGLALSGDGALAITTAAASSIVGTLDVGDGSTLRINTGQTDETTHDFIAASLSGSGTIQNGGGVERWLFVNGAGDTTFNGLLENGGAGALGLYRTGSGTLTLAGTNTHSGQNHILSAVVIRATATNALGNGIINFDNSGGTPGPTSRLELSGGVSLGNTTINLNQRNNDTVAIQNLDGDNQLAGSILITTGGSRVRAQSDAGTLTLAGNISTNATSTRNLYLQGASNGVAGGVISDNPANSAGKISLIKEGAGTWTLSGNNTYTGATTVSAGALLINGISTGSAVTVANNATLGGNGTISGTVTIQSGAIVSPGNSVGRLTINGALSLPANSKVRMEINKPASSHDVLAVSGALTFGGTLEVVSLGGTLVSGDSFTLFEATSIGDSFTTVTLPALGTGYNWDTSQLSGGIIRVVGDPTIYQGWAAGYEFPQGKDTLNSDADDDGMVNAFEWLFGADPLVSDTGFLPQPLVRTLSAAEYPAADPAKHYLTITARVRKIHTGMTLVPQANSSLETLDTPDSAGFVASFLVSDLGDFEQRTWIHTQAIEDTPGGRGFMRLKLVTE